MLLRLGFVVRVVLEAFEGFAVVAVGSAHLGRDVEGAILDGLELGEGRKLLHDGGDFVVKLVVAVLQRLLPGLYLGEHFLIAGLGL
jgi:hypothetical protein